MELGIITPKKYNKRTSEVWKNRKAKVLKELRNLSNHAIGKNSEVIIMGKTKRYFSPVRKPNEHRFDVKDPFTNVVVSGVKCTELILLK